MEEITLKDIDIVEEFKGTLNTKESREKLKRVYEKLDFLCKKLKSKGYKVQIRKDPRNQGGGFKYLQHYLWAKVYPEEFYEECYNKLAYIIGVSDTLHFHIRGIKEYEKNEISESISDSTFKIVQPSNYENLVKEFIEFDNQNRASFIKAAVDLKISGFNKNNMNNTGLIDLLKYKKQIILQGPPGTGKTRLAKQIAEELTSSPKNLMDDAYIASVLKNVGQIDSATDKTQYKIDQVEENKCLVTLLSTGSEYSISYSGIRKAIVEKLWTKGKQKGGLDPYNAALAKYLVENTDAKNKDSKKDYTIIQFHPSYTYEDFVRGITVKSGENGLEYITEDKTIALIAKKAHENYLATLKEPEQFAKEEIIRELLLDFSEKLREKIDKEETVKITESVSITDIEKDAFRYTGNWKTSQRMKFQDIVLAIIQNVETRQELKNVEGISGLAIQHASYFFKVLKMFKVEFSDQLNSITSTIISKPELKNYVLIIDEINRANLSSVLGELIYALEYRYYFNDSVKKQKEAEVESMYDLNNTGDEEFVDKKLILPENLYIIGTMNTADRSVGQIDYAIRRRFAFVDVLPKVLENSNLNIGRKEDGQLKFAKTSFIAVSNLFVKNDIETYNEGDKLERSKHLSEEFNPKDVWLGHSYFILEEKGDFNLKLDYEIKPILEEYVNDGILKKSALAEIEKLGKPVESK